MPGEHNIAIYQGDRWSERYTFQQNLGTDEAPNLQPVDFTGATPRAQIRYRERDAEPVAAFTCAFEGDDPTLGVILVELPSSESAKLARDGVWDLETVLDGESTTWLRGTVSVTLQVTR